MTYTIQIDIFIDDENIASEKEMEDMLSETLSFASVSNVKIVEVND